MNKFIKILFVFGLFLLLPNVVNAKEYTFNVCKNGCEWNENNFEELNDQIENLSVQDLQDNKIDDSYTIKIGDGDYDFSNYTIDIDSKLILGKGIYKFDTISDGRIELIGKSTDETKVYFNYFGPEPYYCDIENIEIFTSDFSIEGEFYFDEIYNNYNSKFIIKNTIINIIDNNYPVEFYFEEYNSILDIIFDNVIIKGNSIVYFEVEKEINKDYMNNFKIINCDFSNSNLYFSSFYYDNNWVRHPSDDEILMQNTKLNTIYTEGAKLILDCGCEFVDGIKRGSGYLTYNEVFSQNQYTLYEYYDEMNSELSGVITLSTCKKKEIKVTDRVILEDLNKELGLTIDDTWRIEPKGIVEIRNNELVPLKTGEADLIKELDKDIYKIHVVVLPDENRVIINPKTNTPIIVLISLLTILFSTIILINIRSMRKS